MGEAFQVAVVHPRAGAEFGVQHLQALFGRQACHFSVAHLHRADRLGGAGLGAAGRLPALVEQVGVEDPVLGELQFLVPAHGAVGAGVDQVAAAAGGLGVDDDDAVVALFHGALARFDAGRVVAVVAHRRQVDDVHDGRLAVLGPFQLQPGSAVQGLRGGVAGEVIADVFVLHRQHAVVAVVAAVQVDDQIPLRRGCVGSPHARTSESAVA